MRHPTAASASPPTTALGAGSSHRSPWGEAATSLVSRNSAGVQAQGASQEAAISATGRYVAFTSSAGNLGGPDSVGDDVFVRDRLTGRTTLVSQALRGQRADGPSTHPASPRTVAS